MMNHSATLRIADCYRILRVSQDEQWDSVKKAYHALAKRYHPDIHPGNHKYEEKLKEITLAFQVLEARYKSSAVAEARVETGEPTPLAVVVTPEAVEEEKNSQEVPFDLPARLREFGDALQGFARRARVALINCERKLFLLDVHKQIRVNAAFAAKGGCLRMRQGRERFEVKIPSGNWTRMSMKIPERGESSLIGKKRGDLILNIRVAGSNQVDAGDTLFFYDMNVPKEEVAHTRIMTLNSVDGPIKFILPRKTKDKESFVLKSGGRSPGVAPSSHVVTIHLV